MVIWLALICINLQALEIDGPAYPWIIVDIPIIIAELCATGGIGFLLYQIRDS